MYKRIYFDQAGGQGGEGGGAGGTAGGVASSATGTGATGGGTGAAWYDSFTTTEVKDWLKAYGSAYPNPEAVALKAYNLEKFVGADKAGRGVIVPKPDAKPEEWRAFYAKTGHLPEKPDGYKIDEALAKDPFIIKFRDEAHKMGMPAPFLQGMLGWYIKEMQGAQQQRTAQFEQKAAQEFEEVKASWGAQYDAKTEAGRRAAAAFIPHKDKAELGSIITRMEGALGTKFTMNFFASIGEQIGEHGYVGGDGASGGGSAAMTPEGARLQIAELKKDKDWTAKYLNGGVEEKALWTKLHAIGYPEQSS